MCNAITLGSLVSSRLSRLLGKLICMQQYQWWNEAESEWVTPDMLSDLLPSQYAAEQYLHGQTMVTLRTRWRHRNCDSREGGLRKVSNGPAKLYFRPTSPASSSCTDHSSAYTHVVGRSKKSNPCKIEATFNDLSRTFSEPYTFSDDSDTYSMHSRAT